MTRHDNSSDTGADAGGPDLADVSGADGADAFVDDLERYEYSGTPGPENTFEHGVASGDPLTDAVIIWTRITTDEAGPQSVWWEVALDTDFQQRVAVGTFETDPEIDHVVKVDVPALAAGTSYFYRFMFLGRTSTIGRTRTVPTNPDRLRLAVTSCASYPHGYYHAYRAMADRLDLDAIVHLGDYIYEYGNGQYGNVREVDPPHEIVSLDDYRRRYRWHRLDPNLQAAHQQHPFIAVWDDHETANDSSRDMAENHTEGAEGVWTERKDAGIQAYMEWMPIRDPDVEGRIYRTFRFGDLADLIMIDTRLWGRDPQLSMNDEEGHADPARSLLGTDQEAWLADQLEGSTAQWRLLGQQVMMAQWRGVGTLETPGPIFNADQWDGYGATRQRFFDTIIDNQLDNVVVLTGDIHSSWAMDLTPNPYDPEAFDPASGDGSIAVEFVCPAITSPGFPDGFAENVAIAVKSANPHMRYVELSKRGYIILDVDRERAQAAWYHFDDITVTETTERFVTAYAAYDGRNRLVVEDAAAAPPTDVPEGAPE